jgi:hypothetical protein
MEIQNLYVIVVMIVNMIVQWIYKIYNMTDKVVEAVREDLLQRSQVGIKKYGITLDRNDLSLKDWLQHAYEECLDQANYLKRSIMELERQENLEFLAQQAQEQGFYNVGKEATEKFPITIGKLCDTNHLPWNQPDVSKDPAY